MLYATEVGLDNVVLFLSADQLTPLRPKVELKQATAHETAGAKLDLVGGH